MSTNDIVTIKYNDIITQGTIVDISDDYIMVNSLWNKVWPKNYRFNKETLRDVNDNDRIIINNTCSQ